MNMHDHWIAGQSRAPNTGKRYDRRSPADGRPIASVALASAEDVDAAVKAARTAFDSGTWSQMPGAARGLVLSKLAGLMQANIDELARTEAEESGKPMAAARAEIAFAIDLTHFAASLASNLAGRLMTDSGSDKLGLVIHQPRGVVALILPWNYPAVCLMQKMPFALAAGCSIVVKPSEMTPGTALAIARLAEEAGVPSGQINIVIGTGDEAGDAITSHPGVDMVSFTGSSRVGKMIAAKCGERFKHYSLELGGKGANIIFADADLDAAVEGAFQGFTINKGEECCAGGRILVEASIEREFTERLIARCRKATLGGPSDEAEIGPLVSEAQLARVEGYIARGKADGARLLIGGERLKEGAYAKGYFVPPTLFADVRTDMAIFREEIFGPVGCILTFETLEEAVRLANDTSYGLANGVWTSNLDKAVAMSRRLKCGMLYVNTYLELIPELPFGGMKESGRGRENGVEGVMEFMETRSVLIRNKVVF